jgi:hypothetical protein
VNCSALSQAEAPVRRLLEVARTGVVRSRQRCWSCRNIRARQTNRFQNAFVFGLLVCLGSAPQMRAEAVAGGAAANPSSPAQSGQVAPSESMSTPGAAVQGGRSSRKTGAHAAAVGSIRGSLATGTVLDKSPRLCFVPGIGWVGAPMTTAGSLGILNAPAPTGSGTSAASVAIGTATATGLTSYHAQPSGANASVNPASSTALQRLTTGKSSVLSGSTQASAGAGSGRSAGTAGTLKFHAYVSSIKQRRLMRSAPDLETRIKPQELQDELGKKTRSSTAKPAGSGAARERLENRPASKTHTSPPSGKRGRATDRAGKLSLLAKP